MGQDHVVRTLRNAVAQGKVHHAYLFVGSRGTGKTSMAKILASCLDCVNGPTVTPCGECEYCLAIQRATSLDVVEMDAASNNSVDDVRELRERVMTAPSGGRWRVYILDEAHMLTTQAWNALLKTLEEPPPQTVFVLATTEAHKVPATVVDRTHRFDFTRPTGEQISRVLSRVAERESITMTPGALGLVARHASGSFRDALGTLEQLVTYAGSSVTEEDAVTVLGIGDDAQLFGAVDAVIAGDAAAVLRVVQDVSSHGRDLGSFARELERHARDLLVCCILGGVPPEVRLTADRDQALDDQARRIGRDQTTRLLELVAAALTAARDGADGRAMLELALVKAADPTVDPALRALQARLARLEERLASGVPAPSPATNTPAPTPAPAAPAVASPAAVAERPQPVAEASTPSHQAAPPPQRPAPPQAAPARPEAPAPPQAAPVRPEAPAPQQAAPAPPAPQQSTPAPQHERPAPVASPSPARPEPPAPRPPADDRRYEPEPSYAPDSYGHDPYGHDEPPMPPDLRDARPPTGDLHRVAEPGGLRTVPRPEDRARQQPGGAADPRALAAVPAPAQPAVDPEPQPTEPAPANLVGGPTLEELASVWTGILDNLRGRDQLCAVALERARPVALEGTELTIAFPTDAAFYRGTADREERRLALREALREVTGTTLSVTFELRDLTQPAAVEPAAPGAPAEAAAPPPGAPTPMAAYNASLDENAVVAHLVTEFDAEELGDPGQEPA